MEKPTIRQKDRDELYKAILIGLSFDSGKLQGEWDDDVFNYNADPVKYEASYTATSAGRLKNIWWRQLKADNPHYVITSYLTPIAWYGRRGWVVPDEEYT